MCSCAAIIINKMIILWNGNHKNNNKNVMMTECSCDVMVEWVTSSCCTHNMNAVMPRSNLLPPRMRCIMELEQGGVREGREVEGGVSVHQLQLIPVQIGWLRSEGRDIPVGTVEQLKLHAVVALVNNSAEGAQRQHLKRRACNAFSFLSRVPKIKTKKRF
jgi:hypothetical protein